MKLRVLLLTFAAALLFQGAASAYLPPKFGGTLTVRLNSKMSRVDPSLATRPDEFNVVLCVFETLIRRGTDGSLEPVLLDSLPEKSDDGLTFYFKLKKDIRFHDGSALDTADVLYTIQRAVKSRKMPYPWIFDAIKGTSNYRSGKASDIAGFKIVDAQRFEISLVKKNPNFLKYLCLPAAAIVSSSNRDFRPPIGTGPFKFNNMSGSSNIVLDYYPDYHEGRPYLDSIRFVVVKDDDDAMVEFRTYRLDVVSAPPDGLKPEDKSRFPAAVPGPMKILYFLEFNPSSKEFASQDTRLAASAFLDRKGMAKVIFNGLGQPESNTPARSAPKRSDSPKSKPAMWYPSTGRAVKFLAQKIKHDLSPLGLDIALDGKQIADLNKYTASSAPVLLLRSLPVFFDMPESIERTLSSGAYVSPFSALSLRAGSKGKDYSREKYAYLYLVSHKTWWLRQNGIFGLNAGSLNEIDFSSVFIRKPQK